MHRIRDTASTEESDILLSASDPAHCACHGEGCLLIQLLLAPKVLEARVLAPTLPLFLAEECDSNYQNTRKNLDEELHVLTFEDLLSFSYQVAKGMEFLTERNVSHLISI